MNAKEATYKVLDNFRHGEIFAGFEISINVDDMVGFQPPHYISTYLRYMREYRQTHDCRIVCVNKRKSLYRMER